MIGESSSDSGITDHQDFSPVFPLQLALLFLQLDTQQQAGILN